MKLRYLLAVAVLLASCVIAPNIVRGPGLAALKPTSTPGPTRTPKMTATFTPVPTTPVPTNTLPAPTGTPLPTDTPAGETAPYPTAPLCTTHDNSLFHTLWNSSGGGCHYDHEHGASPFTAEVEAAFPGFDLPALLGGVQIGHTNPSSPIENTVKHGGMKWQGDLDAPNDCETGFEGADIAVRRYVSQWHAFGNYSVEFEGRIHSALALFEQCVPGQENDPGYAYILQHVDYGLRAWGYQGSLLHYPDDPLFEYDPAFAPYWTGECVGPDVIDQYGITDCRPSQIGRA